MVSIKVFASATVANVSCAYDILGFAVERPGDIIEATLTDSPGVTITEISGDEGRLPKEPHKNTAGVAVQALLKSLKSSHGISLKLKKQMPLGSGLGSSAASAAAALFAANQLLDKPYTSKQLIPFAMEGERIACGAAHADNVAPALLGNFTLIRSYDPLDIITIPSPEGLHCGICHPHIEVKTEDARLILKNKIPLSEAVKQWGNVAALISGLHTSDYELIGRSLTDHIIEQHRSILIPGFDNARSAALANGALGGGISGSGPSLFFLATTMQAARQATEAAGEEFLKLNIDSDIFVSPVNSSGPVIIQN